MFNFVLVLHYLIYDEILFMRVRILSRMKFKTYVYYDVLDICLITGRTYDVYGNVCIQFC